MFNIDLLLWSDIAEDAVVAQAVGVSTVAAASQGDSVEGGDDPPAEGGNL